jgi:hypothetical protein
MGYEVVQALGHEVPQLSPVLHISMVSAAGVFSMKVMSSWKRSSVSLVAGRRDWMSRAFVRVLIGCS